MRHRKIIALLLCLCLLTGLLAACKTEAPAAKPSTEAPSTEAAPVETAPPSTEPPTTEPPVPAPRDLYAEAAARFEAAPERTMTFSITEDRTVGGETVTETITRTVRYQDLDTEDTVIEASDLIVIGLTRAAYTLIWQGGTVYAKVKEARYYSQEELEAFQGNLIPAVLLQPERYGCVTAEGEVLTFSEPLEAELWALPAEAVLEEAGGTAVLSGGELTAVTYEITYLYGSARIHTRYEAALSASVDEDLRALVPESTEGYTKLDAVEAAICLLRARLALSTATVCSTWTYEYLDSEAVEVVSSAERMTHYYEKDGLGCVSEDFHEAYTVGGSDGTSREFSYQEQYLDGYWTFQSTQDGVTTDPVVTDVFEGYDLTPEKREEFLYYQTDENREYYTYFRIWPVPDYNQLTSATMIDFGEFIMLEFKTTEDFQKDMAHKACYDLLGDSDYLDNYATAYRTRSTRGILCLEKGTFLPTSLSLGFEGVHTIYGNKFDLSMELLVKYRIYHPNTYEAITGEPLPDEEPKVLPTPLLYEVTGENGEKLYLFGTVHVGDDRTGFLPQAVRDAFDASDALALEFDADAFWERREADEALEQWIQDSYRYRDGTGIQDHVSGELYALALLRMEIAGEYRAEMNEYMPVVWTDALEDFYLDQSRSLTSSKAVEERLSAWARETDKEILNVESGESHVELLTGYSDQVQEVLLGSIVTMNRREYLDGVSATYEKWCAGDEAALAEEVPDLSEEALAEMSPEARTVYEEYYGTMARDRNAAMTETAVSWLQSGKTVFFAVGVFHMVGSDGLANALAEAGYTVTRIDTGG